MKAMWLMEQSGQVSIFCSSNSANSNMTSWATRSYYGQVSGLKKSSEMQYDLAVLTPTPSYFLSNGSHSLVWRSIPRPAKAGDDKVRQNCLAFLSRNGNVTETWKQKSFPDYSWAQKHLNLSAADFISFQHYNFLASCLQTCTVATNWQNCRGADTSEAVWYGLIHLIFRYLWFLYIHVFFSILIFACCNNILKSFTISQAQSDRGISMK